MSALTSDPARVETPARDRDLWHIALLPNLSRALCGLNLGEGGDDFALGEASGDVCRVCDDLSRAYIFGSWTP